MDRIPAEIWLEIMRLLPLQSLRCCRLVNWHFANMALPLVWRHIAVSNTSTCIQRLLETTIRYGTLSTRKLTVYHTVWRPFSGGSRGVHVVLPCYNLDWDEMNCEAYASQSHSLIQEQPVWESTDVSRLLQALPRLHTIRFAFPPGFNREMNALGCNFWPTPSMPNPFWEKDFTDTVCVALSQVNNFPSITNVEIDGSFSTGYLDQVEHITSLSIRSLDRSSSDDRSLQSFLLAFKNVRHLRIRISGPRRQMPYDNLFWPRLDHLHLDGHHIHTEAFIRMLKRHHDLRRVDMVYVKLLEGWGAVFSALTNLGGTYDFVSFRDFCQRGTSRRGSIFLPGPRSTVKEGEGAIPGARAQQIPCQGAKLLPSV